MATITPVTTSDSPLPIRANPAPKLTKEAIIWLSVISGIVAIAFVVILLLLCGCCRRSKSKKKQNPNDPFNPNNPTHRGHRYFGSVSDDRMDHYAYNRSAPPPSDSNMPYTGSYGNYATASASPPSPTPMGKAKINERLSHRLKDESWRIAEPVVVEHEVGDGGSPMSYRRSGFGRERESRSDEGRARYYSGWGAGFGKRLSRVSQIGKAY